jgi:deazaflavin-dependent oxidoreductase (nitroreductase family)
MTRARPASRLPENRPLRPSWLRSRLAKWALVAYRLGLGFVVGHKVMILTTTGRVSGTERRTPLWYVREGDVVFCLSGWGASSDWLKNVRAHPEVRLQAGARRWRTRGRFIEDPAEVKRVSRMFIEKYGRRTVSVFYHLDRLVLVAFPVSACGGDRDGG